MNRGKLKYSFRIKFAFEKLNYVSFLFFLCAAAEFYEHKMNTKEKLVLEKTFFTPKKKQQKKYKVFLFDEAANREENDDSNKHKNENKKVAKREKKGNVK
jgi:hypothetical protein